MARSSQYWVMFLVVLFVTAATAVLVGADEPAPTIAEQATATHEAVRQEAAPTFAEKMDHTKEAAQELSQQKAEQVREAVKTWREWGIKQAGQWTGKGKVAAGEASESFKGHYTTSAEGLHSSSTKAQESASGLYSKWSNWAKETAGKYRSKKNPAAEAAAYINKHKSGATDEEL